MQAFDRLWENKNPTVWTLDFPEAEKQRLLEFLPTDDRFIVPPTSDLLGHIDEQGETNTPVDMFVEPERPRMTPEEVRDLVWSFIARAPQMQNGLRLGEVTSTVKPWPHQIRSFVRMWDSWPFRLLEASEVGLGKTVIAGLIIRQAWLAKRARRILLLVPKAVINQWQARMRLYAALLVTMFLGGLWHGAAWTFVAWGVLHGLFLCIERPLRERFGDRPWASHGAVQFSLALLTFVLVSITWVFFRAADFPSAGRILASMSGMLPTKALVLSHLDILKAGGVMGTLLAAHWGMRNMTIEGVAARTPWWLLAVLWSFMLASLFITNGSGNAFIYFQF